MDYVIVTDTSSNLPEQIIEEYGLEVLPFVFIVDGVERTSYLKGKTTDLKEFYELMREGKKFTTSLPRRDETEALLKGIFESGKDVLYLGFSSGLSGAYEAIAQQGEELVAQYPGRRFVPIDTLAASMGQGLIVVQAAEMAKNGASLDEVATWVEENKLRACHWFTVDDLMYLYRGGRVSRTSATAANILSIKPVLHVDDDGLLIPMSKSRGRKKSIRALLDQMKNLASAPVADQKVFISHGDCLDDALVLKGMIEDELDVSDITINYIDPVIGAHSGPGTLALFFMGEHR